MLVTLCVFFMCCTTTMRAKSFVDFGETAVNCIVHSLCGTKDLRTCFGSSHTLAFHRTLFQICCWEISTQKRIKGRTKCFLETQPTKFRATTYCKGILGTCWECSSSSKTGSLGWMFRETWVPKERRSPSQSAILLSQKMQHVLIAPSFAMVNQSDVHVMNLSIPHIFRGFFHGPCRSFSAQIVYKNEQAVQKLC